MDNKKLMQILLKDAGELEQFMEEIWQTGNADVLDLELLKTRISGFRRLLEVASGSAETPKEITVPEKTAGIPVVPPIIHEIPDIHVQEEERRPKVRKKETLVEPAPKPASPVATIPKPKTEPVKTEPRTDFPVRQPVINLEEESAPVGGDPTLAEKFVAGKSLNDLLLEKSKPENVFANLPLKSLESGIGTNERFLFTRELFEGNMERFNETIARLDAMPSVREAADFLRDNFKWKKNETSMRFIELVKRRFIK
jgi:hypothetical protein